MPAIHDQIRKWFSSTGFCFNICKRKEIEMPKNSCFDDCLLLATRVRLQDFSIKHQTSTCLVMEGMGRDGMMKKKTWNRKKKLYENKIVITRPSVGQLPLSVSLVGWTSFFGVSWNGIFCGLILFYIFLN